MISTEKEPLFPHRSREEPEEHVPVVDPVRGDEPGVVLRYGAADVGQGVGDAGQVPAGLDVARLDVGGQEEGIAVSEVKVNCEGGNIKWSKCKIL